MPTTVASAIDLPAPLARSASLTIFCSSFKSVSTGVESNRYIPLYITLGQCESKMRVSRYPGLTLRVLGKGTPALGPGKARLVDLIAKTGSLSAAAREMGMSYRRAWMLVAAMNESFREPVVVAET